MSFKREMNGFNRGNKLNTSTQNTRIDRIFFDNGEDVCRVTNKRKDGGELLQNGVTVIFGFDFGSSNSSGWWQQCAVSARGCSGWIAQCER